MKAGVAKRLGLPSHDSDYDCQATEDVKAKLFGIIRLASTKPGFSFGWIFKPSEIK